VKVIELHEETGVKNIKNFYIDLIETLKGESELVLDFSRVKRIDLSLAQILMAARRLAKGDNKILKLRNVSAEVRKQLQIAGLTRYLRE
jgi:anti-anti-sigma regulatory factor